MRTSENIKDLAAALIKAQGEFAKAKKDQNNPFHKSKYANLENVWDACREPLTKNNLCVIQTPFFQDGRVGVTTRLLHSTGQWVEETLLLKPVKDGPQAIGSAITYAKRYSLLAMVGLSEEDDDGNEASGRTPQQQNTTNTQRIYNQNLPEHVNYIKGIFAKFKINDEILMKKLSSDAMKSGIPIHNLEIFIQNELTPQGK